MKNFLHRAFRFLLVWTIPVCIVLAVFSLWNPVKAARQMFSQASTPQPAQQTKIDAARKSASGQALIAAGYTQSKLIQDANLIGFLKAQDGYYPTPSDTFVVFSQGKPEMQNMKDWTALQARDPSRVPPPNVIVDGNGFKVALTQHFGDNRGLTCFSKEDPSGIQPAWYGLNAFVWEKPLEQSITITKANVKELPSEQVGCYIAGS